MQTKEMMVSVWCLAYNHEPYIRDALEGFVAQKTDFPFEVFVHDDASNDGTAAIIREYAEKYPHIIIPILQTENQYSQRIKIFQTHILHRMTGKYIACCEGDDYWCDPNKLQMQVDFLEANPEYVACVHNTKMMNMNTGEQSVMFNGKDNLITPDDTIPRGAAVYHTSSLMYRRKLAYDRPAFVSAIRGVGDYPQAIYLSLMGKIQYFSRVMSVYRWNTVGSWTNRVALNPEKSIINNENTIKMLEMADAFSGGAYHERFSKAKELCQYKILKAKGEFKAALRHPYFRRASQKERVKTIIKAYLPWLTVRRRKSQR